MTKNTTKTAAVAADTMLFDNWFDPIEDGGSRASARLHRDDAGGGAGRHSVAPPLWATEGGRKIDDAAPIVGCRHGHRKRTLTGTFGKTEIAVPRARLKGEDGKTSEWKSKSLRAYQRRTKAADALIAGAYLAGTNTRRVRRAL